MNFFSAKYKKGDSRCIKVSRIGTYCLLPLSDPDIKIEIIVFVSFVLVVMKCDHILTSDLKAVMFPAL